MRKAGDSASFPVKALLQFRTGGELSRQDFNRDDPIEPGIVRAIDLSHSTGADLSKNFIRTKTSPGRNTHEIIVTVQPSMWKFRSPV
jgi:hypothetical protein